MPLHVVVVIIIALSEYNGRNPNEGPNLPGTERAVLSEEINATSSSRRHHASFVNAERRNRFYLQA